MCKCLLNTNLTWKLLKQVSGSTVVDLPNSISELYIDVMGRDNTGNYYRIYSFNIIPRIENVERLYTQGYGYGGADNLCVLYMSANSSALFLSILMENSVNETSNALVTVYYK
jgi:hypothetical protein